jgi:hypothetical protein
MNDIVYGKKPLIQVTHVEARDDYHLWLQFSDGKQGLFDMRPYLDGTVFKPLKQVAFFNLARVDYGTVVWPNEIDISVYRLYDECHINTAK